jgi:hypothetical protein
LHFKYTRFQPTKEFIQNILSLSASGVLQPERQIGSQGSFILEGIYLYLHTPRGAPGPTEMNSCKGCRQVTALVRLINKTLMKNRNLYHKDDW